MLERDDGRLATGDPSPVDEFSPAPIKGEVDHPAEADLAARRGDDTIGTVDHVDHLGRPRPAESDNPAGQSLAEQSPPPDQLDVPPASRTIGEGVHTQGQNAQGSQGRT